MVKKVRHYLKFDWLTGFEAVIGDGGGKVGFTAAGNTLEYQPAFR